MSSPRTPPPSPPPQQQQQSPSTFASQSGPGADHYQRLRGNSFMAKARSSSASQAAAKSAAVSKLKAGVIQRIVSKVDSDSSGSVSPDKLLQFCQTYLTAIEAPQHLQDHADRMSEEVAKHCPAAARAADECGGR